MDLLRYLSVLVICFVDSHAGGHGGKHHVNLKIHLPEFIHHDHHKKVITIHHHHHKPKKEHHHHHHHHKPHIPHGHHYHHHHKKTSTHSLSKGHSNHHGHGQSHHGHGHHGHHGHPGNHGHGHEHKHHDIPIAYNPPVVNYEPPTVSYEPPSFDYTPLSFNHDIGSFSPPSPSVPSPPHVHGVVHTVKQVKVFDSLPNALPGAKNAGGHGYEVTEEGNDDDDVVTLVNTVSQAFPGTLGFVKSAAEQGNPFSAVAQQSSLTNNHDPFASAIQPTSYANLETFTGSDQKNLYPSHATENGLPTQFTSSGHEDNGVTGFDESSGNVIGGDIGSRALLSTSGGFNEDTPVTFSRQAGVQQTIKTEGIETVEY